MFCYISKNWKVQPLIDIGTVVSLIYGTTTQNGLKINCIVDNNIYETGRKISVEELQSIWLFDNYRNFISYPSTKYISTSTYL